MQCSRITLAAALVAAFPTFLPAQDSTSAESEETTASPSRIVNPLTGLFEASPNYFVNLNGEVLYATPTRYTYIAGNPYLPGSAAQSGAAHGRQMGAGVTLLVDQDGRVAGASEGGQILPEGCLLEVGADLMVLGMGGGALLTLQSVPEGGYKLPQACLLHVVPTLLPTTTCPSRIGVDVAPLDAALARHLGLEPDEAIVVAEVEEGGPAAQAGIEQYDVIVSLDGARPVTADLLRDKVAATMPGQTIAIEVQRGMKRIVCAVVAVASEPMTLTWPNPFEIPVWPHGNPYVPSIPSPFGNPWTPGFVKGPSVPGVPEPIGTPFWTPTWPGFEITLDPASQGEAQEAGEHPAGTEEKGPEAPVSFEQRLAEVEAKLAELLEAHRALMAERQGD